MKYIKTYIFVWLLVGFGAYNLIKYSVPVATIEPTFIFEISLVLIALSICEVITTYSCYGSVESPSRPLHLVDTSPIIPFYWLYLGILIIWVATTTLCAFTGLLIPFGKWLSFGFILFRFLAIKIQRLYARAIFFSKFQQLVSEAVDIYKKNPTDNVPPL